MWLPSRPILGQAFRRRHGDEGVELRGWGEAHAPKRCRRWRRNRHAQGCVVWLSCLPASQWPSGRRRSACCQFHGRRVQCALPLARDTGRGRILLSARYSLPSCFRRSSIATRTPKPSPPEAHGKAKDASAAGCRTQCICRSHRGGGKRCVEHEQVAMTPASLSTHCFPLLALTRFVVFLVW
jgi:hypothetical protein